MTNIISFDYAIKYLLKSKADYEIVEGFISALLISQGYSAVKIKALLESESNREDADSKRTIADVIVEDEQGHKYIVEIDRSYSRFFLHKACFNSSRLIVDSINKGDDYSNIKKIFHINLIYFPFADMKTPLYHGKTIVREVDTSHPMDLHLTDKNGQMFDMYDLFPEYFIISVPLFNDIIRNEMDEWLYLMKNSDVKKDFKSPYMKKIAERLNILKMTPSELRTYNEHRNKSLKERDQIVSAEEIGEARGEARGKAEGEAKKAIEIAKNLLSQGIDINIIEKATGMEQKELEKLIKNSRSKL